jgi:AcrR family transcriptional regulator
MQQGAHLADPKRRRGRPRQQAVDQRISRSALVLLRQKGYENFSFDELARLASVSRTSIYRRWDSKAALVFDLLAPLIRRSLPPSEEENTRLALGDTLRRVIVLRRGPFGRVLLELLVACRRQTRDLTTFRTAFFKPYRERVKTTLARGVARGEIRNDLDLSLLADGILGPVVFGTTLGEKYDAEAIQSFLDLFLNGACVKVKGGQK